MFEILCQAGQRGLPPILSLSLKLVLSSSLCGFSGCFLLDCVSLILCRLRRSSYRLVAHESRRLPDGQQQRPCLRKGRRLWEKDDVVKNRLTWLKLEFLKLRLWLLRIKILHPMPNSVPRKGSCHPDLSIIKQNTHPIQQNEPSKRTKYIDMRVDDAYPVKKLSDMLKLQTRRPYSKDGLDQSTLHNRFPSSTWNVKLRNQAETSCAIDDHNMASLCPESDSTACNSELKLNSCTQNKFCHVAELSFGGVCFSDSSHIDMDVALKGFATAKPPNPPLPDTDSVGRFTHQSGFGSDSFCHEVCIFGDKAPVDFTLKSSMRLVSSSSVSWYHRLNSCGPSGCTAPFLPSFECKKIKISSEASQSTDVSEKSTSLYSEALCSWMYPQSSLPSSIISAMTISAARRGSAERDFLTKRQLDWEDSFRSLYYMLRRNDCNLFYVYTSQFIAMFIAGDELGLSRHTCNAYLSRSTRGLRALLKEHDVEFTMPLCHSEVENPTSEDLHELSEFEKRNPGQTCHQDYMYNIDNNCQSLLAFVGNENVHGLYDLLLNYRSFLNSLTSVDVPILYSPVAFQNASVHSPQVRCKQMKRADAVLLGGSYHAECERDASCSICYSIEIRDTILPPWLICRVCKGMGSDGLTFEASFTVHPLSSGLNVVLGDICPNASGEGLSEKKTINFMDALLDVSLKSASVQGLKYRNGSYVASLLPD